MWMLKITTMDDLVKNSMNILEPSPVDASGNDREDGKVYFHVTGKLYPHIVVLINCINRVANLILN